MDSNRMKSTYMLRILAGAYLIYIAYSLVGGYVKGESPSFWIALAGIAFGIIGAGLLYFSIKGWIRCTKAANDPDPEPEDDKKEEDEKRAE